MKRGVSVGNIPSNVEQDDDGAPFAQVRSKSRRNKKGRFNAETAVQKDVSVASSSNSSSYVAPSVLDATANVSTSDEVLSLKAEVNALNGTVKRLSETINAQKDIITTLSIQLQSVVSFLGLNESNIQSSNVTANELSKRISTAVSSAVSTAVTVSDSNSDTSSQYDVHNQASKAIQPSYSTALKQRQQQQKIVAAVYIDTHDKERRSRNVIVSGLKCVADVSDNDVVLGLFDQ